MKVTAPGEGSSVEHVQRRIPPDTRLGTIHTGSRYVLGFGPDSYGIWDEFSKGSPVERFPATDAGRSAAWQRYLELEPAARETYDRNLAAARPQVEEVRARRRWPVVVVALVVVAGAIIGFVVAQSGGGGTTGGNGGATVGKEAHIDVSGGQTLSEDMPLEAFKTSAIQAVFGGVVDATWKGPTAELHIEMHSPSTGSGNTTQIPLRTIDLTLTPAPGTTVQISSQHGECSFTVQNLTDDTFSGTFTCSGLTATGLTSPIDVKGTFGASK